MKISISTIPQIYRNLKRWREILSVLSKYGLADWLSRVNLDFVKDQLKAPDGEALARLSHERRIRLALSELGPTFIKLGQLLSTRPDIVGVKLANELKQLQSDAPADPFDKIRKLVESELGQPLEGLFAEFSEEPIASASIGQVHRARMTNGDVVVVKVQHIGIEEVIRDDLDVLSGAAQLAERFDEFKPYKPIKLVGEMARSLRRELDFGREERNLQQFAAMFDKDPTVRVPKPFGELCTARVLTMESLDGVKVEDRDALLAGGFDLDELALRGASLYLKMIFQHGFYHADPHPGNLVMLPGNVIGLLDFGMVGRLGERLREDIEEMLLSIVNQDVVMLTMILKRVGSVPFDLDDGALGSDVADFVGQHATQSLDEFDLTGALNDMIEMIRRHQISLPTEVALLIKTLATLDGTAKLLSPKFSLIEVMQPLHRSMLLRRLSPMRQVRKMRRIYVELEQIAEVLPQRLMNILDQVQSGKFDIHLDHRRLGPSVNRLVIGMITSAIFVGSALMLSYDVPPLLFPVPEGQPPHVLGVANLSILGLGGVTLSILVGLRLLWAIRKSGNLDRNDMD